MPTSLLTRFLTDVLVSVIVVSCEPRHRPRSSTQEGTVVAGMGADIVVVRDGGTVISVDHHVVTGCGRRSVHYNICDANMLE